MRHFYQQVHLIIGPMFNVINTYRAALLENKLTARHYALLLFKMILFGKPSLCHYQLIQPVYNVSLIKTQSIAHYTVSIDRRELEVCLMDERSSHITTHATIQSQLFHQTSCLWCSPFQHGKSGYSTQLCVDTHSINRLA